MKILILLLLFGIFGCATSDPRTKIVIWDTGIDRTDPIIKDYLCKYGHKSFADTPWYTDEQQHGTYVAQLTVKDLDPTKYCVISVKWMGKETFDGEFKSMNYLLGLDHDYLNMSFTFGSTVPSKYNFMFLGLIKRVQIFVAAGNELINLDAHEVYPASFNLSNDYFHVIGDNEGTFYGPYSNYGSAVDYWVSGIYKGHVGTSFSSPRALNLYILGRLTSNPNQR